MAPPTPPIPTALNRSQCHYVVEIAFDLIKLSMLGCKYLCPTADTAIATTRLLFGNAICNLHFFMSSKFIYRLQNRCYGQSSMARY